ncbi:hypothetical protein [Phenylobacterium sp.]|uniref:hypothetical protein n=1 Tax=Phenylobacterium sp. TaxID=1871053 RepID=UPI002ED9581D
MRPILASAAAWLNLAAAPTFAAMALVTGALDARASVAPCGPPSAAPLSGMVVMYLLMSGFHLGPWLRLAAPRRAPS